MRVIIFVFLFLISCNKDDIKPQLSDLKINMDVSVNIDTLFITESNKKDYIKECEYITIYYTKRNDMICGNLYKLHNILANNIIIKDKCNNLDSINNVIITNYINVINITKDENEKLYYQLKIENLRD